MRISVVAAAAAATLASLAIGLSPASAAPQMLAVVETVSAVPLHCRGGECTAELTAICLQEKRATPTPGFRYFVHNPEAIALTGIRRDGTRVALLVENVLQFSAARGYSAVQVGVAEDVLRAHDVTKVEVSVGSGLTLVPEDKSIRDDAPLSEADIELGAGPLRQTATAIVDRDADRLHASLLLARLIDGLPRRGHADPADRTQLWETTATPHVARLSSRGVHRARTAYNGCYRETRIGDETLRECLGRAHDSFIQELNAEYWQAVKTGS